MGGKTGTTTSSVQIPPEVLARYNAVNAQAQQTAQTPFQQYSTDPNAFVAPLNTQQNAGISNINQYANAAQPAYGAAMQGTAQAYQGFNPQNYQQGVAGYMNPFVNQAMGATAAQLQNVNQQQQQQLLGNTIQQGAFGGDRGNIAQAALMNQQNLALGNTLSNMASQGYQNAAQNYMTGLGQQGALANQMGALGAGAQTAGLTGAQAQLGAGTLGQQTSQAGLTALYNQFQQQQAYPFQTAQFLANIAEGTGALSGSTTTTTSPTSFFSDRRLKHDIHRIGETDEGLPIYKFKYKGDDKTNIGFMADEVEKIHPEAVGESHGFKTVDYDRAARYAGGLVGNSEGGAVSPMHTREGYFDGGDVINPIDLQNILASQKQSYAPFQQGGLYGATSGGTPGGKGYVPAGSLPVARLAVANPARTQAPETLMGDIHEAADLGQDVSKLNQYRKDIWGQKAQPAQPAQPATSSSPAVPAQPAKPATGLQAWFGDIDQPQQQYRGGLVKGYADGGDVEPYSTNDPMEDVVKSGEKNPAQLKLMQAQPISSGGSGGGTLGQLASLAAIPGEISTIGSGIGQAASAVLPFFGIPLATGGLVGRRRRFADGGDTDSAPIADVATIENSAQNAGLNVGDFRKLAQGESGNKFTLGDDGSSAGPFQLHVGGISQQYPHPGKGDDFFNEMHPDLAQKFTPQQKVAYINDPANLQETSDWTANQIAKNGANAWTVARQQGLLGATRPADMSAKNAAIAGADGDQGAQGFQPPGGNQPKTLGDALTSESILIPLLSGLGAMASSNSRYLGAALLQGIGAGAKSYEDVQNQMLERRGLEPIVQQRNIQTLSDLTSGLAEYNSKMGTNLTLPQYAAMVNYKGQIPANAVSGGTSTAGQGSAAGQSFVNQGYTYTPQEMQNLVIDRNGVQIKAMNDPLYMQGYAAHWRQAGNNQFAQNQVSFANEQIARNSTYTRDVNGNMVASPGSISTGQQVQYAGNKVAQANKFVDQGNDLSASYETTRKSLQDLQDAYNKYTGFRAGSLGIDRSALDRIAQELDPDGKIPALHGLSQDSSSEQYDIAMKSAAQLVARQLQGMSTVAPKSEIGLLNSFAANPEMSPGAIRSIIVRGKALLDYNQALHSNFRPENENFDVQNYINKFNGDHDYSNEFIGKNEKETPWMKGQAPAMVQNENDIARLPSGAPFVVPYGPSKGQIRYAP